MAISVPGIGAAAGSIGQMLMQKALQDREREDLALERKDITDIRREQALSRRLGALGATGDAFLPYTPGMKPPETAEPVNVMGESFFRVPKAPAAPKLPPVLETSSGIFTRGGAGLEPVIDPVTKKPAMPYQAPPRPTQAAQLPFGVSVEGISTRTGSLPEALRAREQLQLGGGGDENQRLAQNAMSANRALNELDAELTKIVPGLARQGGLLGAAANIFTGERGQQAATAADNFTNAAVRYLSGKGMSQQEREGYRRALTGQIGDKEGTLQFKRVMRDELLRAMQSGEWQGQIGPNGEPDVANLEAFITQFQAEGAAPEGIGGGTDVQLPGTGLPQSITPSLDAFTDTTTMSGPGGAKRPITQDQADYLRNVRGMADEEIATRYIVR